MTDKALLFKNLLQNCIPETILQMEYIDDEEFLAKRSIIIVYEYD